MSRSSSWAVMTRLEMRLAQTLNKSLLPFKQAIFMPTMAYWQMFKKIMSTAQVSSKLTHAQNFNNQAQTTSWEGDANTTPVPPMPPMPPLVPLVLLPVPKYWWACVVSASSSKVGRNIFKLSTKSIKIPLPMAFCRCVSLWQRLMAKQQVAWGTVQEQNRVQEHNRVQEQNKVQEQNNGV